MFWWAAIVLTIALVYWSALKNRINHSDMFANYLRERGCAEHITMLTTDDATGPQMKYINNIGYRGSKWNKVSASFAISCYLTICNIFENSLEAEHPNKHILNVLNKIFQNPDISENIYSIWQNQEETESVSSPNFQAIEKWIIEEFS